MAVGRAADHAPGRPAQGAALFLGGVAATAGFWFLRNLIHSGNPLPWLREIGPIDLPGPDRGLEGRDNFTVAHYIFETRTPTSGASTSTGRSPTCSGRPGSSSSALAAAGAVLAIARPRTPTVRMLGAVTIVAAIAYLFTPLTAAGPEGDPLAFGINLRYLVPALALGLALLPLEPKLTPERFRLPLLGGGVLALLADLALLRLGLHLGRALRLDPVRGPDRHRPGRRPGRHRSAGPTRIAACRVGAAVAVALAIAAVGWERQDDYLDARYTRAEDFRFQLDELARVGQGQLRAQRIGVAGTSGAYNQYLLYGDELSNRVQYIGRELGAGDFRTLVEDGGPGKCTQFVEAINDGDYDYVVTTPELDLNDPATAKASPERGWLIGVAGAEQVLRDGRVSVFRIERRAGPGGLRAGARRPSRPSNDRHRRLPARDGRAGRDRGLDGDRRPHAAPRAAARLDGRAGAAGDRAAGAGDAGRDLGAARAGRPPRRGAADRRLPDRRRRRRCAWSRCCDQRTRGRAGGSRASGTRAGRLEVELWVAVAVAALVAAQWAGPTLLALDRGIYGGDSLWYHMPFAAHIAQTGSVTELLFTDPLYLNWFYPQNSELLHADGLLLLGNDFLSPLLNLAWLGLALLAAWCMRAPLRRRRARRRGDGRADVGQPPVLAPAGQRQQRRRRDRALARSRRDPA